MFIVKPFRNNTRFATLLLFVFSTSGGWEGREGMASRKLAKMLCFPGKPLIPQKYQTNKKKLQLKIRCFLLKRFWDIRLPRGSLAPAWVGSPYCWFPSFDLLLKG